MIDSNQLGFLLFALIGAVAGIGLLLVKPAPDDPELLDRFWPGARIYRLRCVRVILGFFILGLTTFVLYLEGGFSQWP